MVFHNWRDVFIKRKTQLTPPSKTAPFSWWGLFFWRCNSRIFLLSAYTLKKEEQPPRLESKG